METHYVPWFTRRQNVSHEQAACGEYVRPVEISSEPTCEKCQTYVLAERETEQETVEDRFGVADPSTVVKVVPFDCTGGRPRR